MDMEKIGIRVSSLSKQIVIARFGKDPELALDSRNVENEFFHALCDYAFDHKMPKSGEGVAITFGSGEEQFTATVRRFTSMDEAKADTALRGAAGDMFSALEQCQHALAMMIAPDAIRQTTTLNAFEQATTAEANARAAMSKAKPQPHKRTRR